MQLLIYLSDDGEAAALDGDTEQAKEELSGNGHNWADWPEDLGVYEQGAGFLILDVEFNGDCDDPEYKNPKFTRVTESQFRLIQTYGTIWFE